MSRAGAQAKPMGEIPSSTKTVSQGVKSASPTVKESVVDENIPEPPKEVQEPELNESDLEALEKQQNVPYSRFKEVNERAKAAQKQLADREQEYQRLVRKAEEDAEIRVQARLAKQKQEQDDVYEADPTTRELKTLQNQIQSLQGELSHLRGESKQEKLSRTLKELEAEYPDADSLAVLGWSKTRYGSDPKREQLEELMAMSHERQQERVRTKIQGMIQAKKQKKVSILPTRESGPRFKPEESPKTVREAAAAFRKYLASGGE